MRQVMLLLALLAFFIISESCAMFGGGGCGGGCGCGCGCGRKKRSIDAQEFQGIVSNDSDMLCNSPELRQIISRNMKNNAIDSSKSIQLGLEAENSERYVVVCSENIFRYAVHSETVYCGARNGTHYCQAFAI